MEEVVFLRGVFREYYFKHSNDVEVPSSMGEREFGYLTFDGAVVRHLSYKEAGELTAMLVRDGPKAVYYSCAYYQEPKLPMGEKGWKGADLIFDIDADDLSLPCKEEHDFWACKHCGFREVGSRPERCPQCGNSRIEETNWVCESCLGKAKEEAIKLSGILQDDLGFDKDEVKFYFSGNMGYHISVESPRTEALDQGARNELAHYMLGLGLKPESLGVYKGASYEDLLKSLPSVQEPGWRGRIAKHYSMALSSGGDKGAFASYVKKKGYRAFSRELEGVARTSGVAIDSVVTTDIHRIFRLPGTLHGETGLLKVRCDDDLLSFNPLVDSIAFGEEPLKVHVSYAPAFSILGRSYGPYKDQGVTVPLHAAIYLLGRGAAKLTAG